jgi:hypothetical protein
MTIAQENDLLKQIDALVDALNVPTKRNQIKNERLRYTIALILASEHNHYWKTEGMDRPEDPRLEDAFNAISGAFTLIDEVAITPIIQVSDDAKTK